MSFSRRFVFVSLGLLLLPATMSAQAPLATLVLPSEAKMPFSGLAPARLIPDLCVVKYRISTRSPECQAFFDQGLGYLYSYVWMEAARSFETAARHDPNCAMAWWGLSRSLESWGKGKPLEPLKKAQELLSQAAPHEKLLITARLQHKGLVELPKTASVAGDDPRKNAAIATLDELLMLHDDEEGYFNRAQLASRHGAAAYYKALLRLNPLHAGANHELVHFYENIRRPALGWIYAEKYMESSPGLPHAFHMQAHLAMRLGRWDKSTNRSVRAIEMQRAYHQFMHVKPTDDWQYSHHLKTLLLGLIHDGRFREARLHMEEAKKSCKIKNWNPWGVDVVDAFRLHLAERQWEEALRVAQQIRKTEKTRASYLSALAFLKQGDLGRALPELEVLQQAYQTSKSDRALETQLLEVQGLALCQSGAADAGLKMLFKLVDKTKDDYTHHSWGHGAYYMEAWGIAALQSGRFDVAEEALQEAIAHDPGSVRGALGMQVLCEMQGRTEEATRFAALARRCWSRAEVQHFDLELAALRASCPPQTVHNTQQTVGERGVSTPRSTRGTP